MWTPSTFRDRVHMNAHIKEMSHKLAAARDRVSEFRSGSNRHHQHLQHLQHLLPPLPPLPPLWPSPPPLPSPSSSPSPSPPPPLSPPPAALLRAFGSLTSFTHPNSFDAVSNVVLLVAVLLAAARALQFVCDKMKRAQHDALLDGSSEGIGRLTVGRSVPNFNKQRRFGTPRRRADSEERVVLLAA